MTLSIELQIYFYPSQIPITVMWYKIPCKGESVFYEGIKYDILDVWHHMDKKEIKIFLDATR